MSTHPNVILMLVLTPDESSRKTFRSICSDAGAEIEEGSAQIRIGERTYTARVMENEYDDDFQISASEGDIVVYTFMTYGYGEKVDWDSLSIRRSELDAWAMPAASAHKCKAVVYVTANYW